MDPDVQQEAEKMRERCRRYLELGGPVDDGWDSVPALSAAGKQSGGGAEAAAAAGKAGGSLTGSSRSGSGVVHLEAVTPTAMGQQEQQEKLQGAAGQAAGQVGSTSSTSSSSGASSVLAAPRRYALEMYGLRKAYRHGGLVLRRRKPFVAVRGNWLAIYEGGKAACSCRSAACSVTCGVLGVVETTACHSLPQNLLQCVS